MITDVVKITNAGEGMDDAFAAAASSASYRKLDKKSALHLRLLTEEMLGMFRQITGETKAEFWVESNEKCDFELHLVAYPSMTAEMRQELIKVSSSGKNAAAKGIMGKIRDVFDRALLANIDLSNQQAENATRGAFTPVDFSDPQPAQYSAAASRMIWSLMNYKSSVEGECKNDNAAAKEDWDELEKSIVANVADEIRIAIKGSQVEMIVYKKFNK